MEFPESDLMQTLPKQFFAALVAKVNKKIAEGYDVINLGQEILTSRRSTTSSKA